MWTWRDQEVKFVAGVTAWLGSACLLKEDTNDKCLSINPCADPKWRQRLAERKVGSGRRYSGTAVFLFLETSSLSACLLQIPLALTGQPLSQSIARAAGGSALIIPIYPVGVSLAIRIHCWAMKTVTFTFERNDFIMIQDKKYMLHHKYVSIYIFTSRGKDIIHTLTTHKHGCMNVDRFVL